MRPKKPFFFGSSAGWGGCGADRCGLRRPSVSRPLQAGGAVAASGLCPLWSTGSLPARPRGYPNPNGCPVALAAVQGAGAHWFGPGDENFVLLLRALGGSRHAGFGVDGDGHDAIRRFERLGVRYPRNVRPAS